MTGQGAALAAPCSIPVLTLSDFTVLPGRVQLLT